MLMKNGKTVYYNIICGDYVFVAAARKYFNYRELSEKKKKKKWNKKKPFWWFDKKEYFEELKKFRSELNLTRKKYNEIYNELQKYNERKAEINSILEYFNKNLE